MTEDKTALYEFLCDVYACLYCLRVMDVYNTGVRHKLYLFDTACYERGWHPPFYRVDKFVDEDVRDKSWSEAYALYLEDVRGQIDEADPEAAALAREYLDLTEGE